MSTTVLAATDSQKELARLQGSVKNIQNRIQSSKSLEKIVDKKPSEYSKELREQMDSTYHLQLKTGGPIPKSKPISEADEEAVGPLKPCKKTFEKNKEFLSNFSKEADTFLALPESEQRQKLDHMFYKDTLSFYRGRVYGLIYGHAIGDSIGLLTENMNKKEAEKNYSEKMTENEGKLLHKFKVKDDLRKVYLVGDFTSNTDQIILLMKSYVEMEKLSVSDFCKSLQKWHRFGFLQFHEFFRSSAYNLKGSTDIAVRDADFLQNPQQSCHKAWLAGDAETTNKSHNEALSRCTVLGATETVNNQMDAVLEFCSTLNPDSMCVACCLTYVSMLSRLLQNAANNAANNIDEMINESIKTAASITKSYCDNLNVPEIVWNAELEGKLKQLAGSVTLEELDLYKNKDDCLTTLKTGFWALKQENFEKTVTKIAMEGGSASTNCAIAAALLGAKNGMIASIPPHWQVNLSPGPVQELSKSTREFFNKIANPFFTKNFKNVPY